MSLLQQKIASDIESTENRINVIEDKFEDKIAAGFSQILYINERLDEIEFENELQVVSPTTSNAKPVLPPEIPTRLDGTFSIFGENNTIPSYQ